MVYYSLIFALMLFPKHLFWDVRTEQLDIQQDQYLIIPRMLYTTKRETFEKDIQTLEQWYSPEEIVKHLKTTQEKISDEVCVLVAKRYQVPLFYRWERN